MQVTFLDFLSSLIAIGLDSHELTLGPEVSGVTVQLNPVHHLGQRVVFNLIDCLQYVLFSYVVNQRNVAGKLHDDEGPSKNKK